MGVLNSIKIPRSQAFPSKCFSPQALTCFAQILVTRQVPRLSQSASVLVGLVLPLGPHPLRHRVQDFSELFHAVLDLYSVGLRDKTPWWTPHHLNRPDVKIGKLLQLPARLESTMFARETSAHGHHAERLAQRACSWRHSCVHACVAASGTMPNARANDIQKHPRFCAARNSSRL